MSSEAPLKRQRTSRTTRRGSTATPSVSVSADTARLYRFHASFLLPAARVTNSPGALAGICGSLVGIQAQEPGSASLALWNRLRPSTRSEVPNRSEILAAFSAETVEHGVIRCHGQRGTLHLYDTGTWPVVSAAVRDRVLKSAVGVVGEACLKDAHDELAAKLCTGRVLTRDDLYKTSGPHLPQVAFMSLSFSGLGARTDVSGTTVFTPWTALVPPNTAPWTMPAFDVAVRRAAEKYFTAFGPATERDFRYYFKLTAKVSKCAVAQLEEQGSLVRVKIEPGEDGQMDGFSGDSLIARDAVEFLSKCESKQESTRLSLPLMLLGRFDVLLLGHEDKSWIVPPEMKHEVWTTSSGVLAVVIVRGRAQGLWNYTVSTRRRQTEVEFKVHLFPEADWNEESDLVELKSRMADLSEKFFCANSWRVSVEYFSTMPRYYFGLPLCG